jgi:hypothetical protein
MSEIDNNNRSDNDEQRRIQRTRENNRKDLERKLANEPAKTFEAKMSAKASREKDLKQQSQARQKGGDRKKKAGEEDESLIAHFLGAARESGAEEAQGRVDRLRGQTQHDDFEQHAKDEFGKDDTEAHESKDTKTTTAKTDKGGKTEVSGESHKRVEGQASQGGGEGGTGQGSSQGQDGGGQQGFGAGTGRDGSQNKQAALAGKNAAGKPGTVFAVKQTGTGSQGRFQQQAPAFTRKDLDDIVASVELSVASGGNDQLTVQLENTYYDGLKIQAERTDQGVILRFICPNTSVRSTFVKYRPQVYDHLKAKGVKVFRIDVV